MFFMTWVIVGLGNPEKQHEHTPHNAGRMALQRFVEGKKMGEWAFDKKSDALVVRGEVGKESIVCALPETFMNKSGNAVAKFVKSIKAAEKLVVGYDDLDLPLGSMKISFDRGSGGHKGIESVARAVKTKKFWRIRIGVSPATPSGKIKKPQGEKEVLDFILKPFRPNGLEALKPVLKRTSDALELILTEGPMKAMNKFN